ncbi:MAG: hypothetical protein ACRDDH_00030 [Cetobacterium sp.]|uniref:hypothetical protein n=1 Tax=Cetobacterium sp. TaxID=2071632 RepID=UPI003EE5B60E
MSRILDFGSFSTPCITDSENKNSPEDIFKMRIRDDNDKIISDNRMNFSTLHIIRTSEKQIYVALQTKKKFSKKTLISIIFSHFSNVDFFSTHNNCCPPYFLKVFSNVTEEFGCCKIISMQELFQSVQTCYLLLKDQEVMQPELNYFRYKLECIILSTLFQKSNRNAAIMGLKKINDSPSICVKDIPKEV